jgi:hypothetical protein
LTEGIDSSLASVAALTTVEDEHSPYFAAVPPLAWMAGVATFADLLINRVLIRLGSDRWSEGQIVRLDTWGVFARNLSVISSLVALSFCLVAFSSRKSALPFSARASIAAFGWVLIPVVMSMTFLPLGRTGWEWVLVESGIAHSLILLLVLAGLHWRSTHSTSAALVLTLIAVLSGLLATVVTSVGGRTYWEHTERLSNAFRWSGELAYLAVPLMLSVAVATPIREARGKLAIALAALTAGFVVAGIAFWKHAVGQDLPDLLYGALGLEFLPGKDFMFYSIPLGIGSAVTVAALVSKTPASRETGAALLLLLSAGYAPRTPSALITTVLGVALLVRASIALARDRAKTRN